MSLPEEVKAKYITIIDEILASSDLAQITEKRIRNGIQARVEYDILPQKAAIKELIMQRFDEFNSRQNGAQEPVQSIEGPDLLKPVLVNGHSRTETPSVDASAKREADDSDLSDVRDSPPKKKRKAESVDDDAAFAAKLQAEENRTARATRGVATRKAAPKKSKSKKKKSKVTASDDSDGNESSSPRKPKSNTGFNKPLTLTPIAAEFFGTSEISRPQATKALWAHIRQHDLQDPADKRFIICDEKLKTLLKSDRISMFHMPKNLNLHFVTDE